MDVGSAFTRRAMKKVRWENSKKKREYKKYVRVRREEEEKEEEKKKRKKNLRKIVKRNDELKFENVDIILFLIVHFFLKR